MFTENGGEFANKTFSEINEKRNVSSDITDAESQWSNDALERRNAIL